MLNNSINPNQLSLLDLKQTSRQPRYTDYTFQHREHIELQDHLPTWLRELGWELYSEPAEGFWEIKAPTHYRAWHPKEHIVSEQATTPAAAVIIAEHATQFYGFAMDKWPKGYQLPPDLPLFPETWRTWVDGIKRPAISEYYEVWIPLHKKREKYYSK